MLMSRRVVQPFFALLLLLCLCPAMLRSAAQQMSGERPLPRIHSSLMTGERTALPNSRSPLARFGQDLGPVDSAKTLHGITMVFKRSAAQEADLDALLAAQQDSKSALYHHWLTPDAFAARFGMADGDLAAAKGWLLSRGFSIDNVPASHDRINFSGTIAQVQAAFAANVHNFLLDGVRHSGPTSDIVLPSGLTPVVGALEHLSTGRPLPSARPVPRPLFTDAASGTHYLAPADLPIMYNGTALAAAAGGTGQAIAVVGQSYVDSSSYVRSDAELFLGAQEPSAYVFVPGSGVQAVSPGDQAESDIDLEYVSALARQASIYLVYVGDSENYDVFDAIQYAITTDIAPVISISYGICEALLSGSDLDAQNALFMQAAAQGQTVVASSGDSGPTTCARYGTSQQVTSAIQEQASTSFPADSPFVTAAGGTQMAPGTFAAGANQYWSDPGGSVPAQSLLSYVPESAWNEDVSGNLPFAGGGGPSAHFPRPSWQAGVPGIPDGAFRLLPDIALQASVQDPGFVLCTEDGLFYEEEGGRDASCSQGIADAQGLYTVAGGTSFAAPVFAGLVASLNQLKGFTGGQGAVNPTLYALAADPATYASAFHDVLTGSTACTSGVLNCGPDGQAGFAAGVGYDEATGLGSVDVANLAAAWPGAPAGSPNLQFTQMQTSTDGTGDPGTSVTLNVSVYVPGSVANPTPPTGTVSVALDGVTLTSSAPLEPSTAGINPAGNLGYPITAPTTQGTHVVVVSYGGDATHAASRGTQTFMVGNVAPSGGITLGASNLTLAPNGQGSIQIVVTPNNGYHGRVFWDLSLTSGTSQLSGCYSLAPLLVSSAGSTSATLTLGIGEACSASASANQRQFGGSRTKVSVAQPGEARLAPVLSFSGCFLLCGALLRRRKTLLGGALLSLLVALAVSPALLGCGSSSPAASTPAAPAPTTPSSPTPAPSAATYTFSLYGVDRVNPGVNATTTFSLTVSN